MAGAGLLMVVFAISTGRHARAQDADDQGWGQFSRENTLRGTVVSAASTGKNDGSFAVKTDSGQPWKVLYGVNTRLMKGRDAIRASEIMFGGGLDGVTEDVFRDVAQEIPTRPVEKSRLDLALVEISDHHFRRSPHIRADD